MTDIVEHLRAVAARKSSLDRDRDDMLEAAAEIERLRREIAMHDRGRLELIEESQIKTVQMAELRDEIERLQAELKELDENGPAWMREQWTERGNEIERLREEIERLKLEHRQELEVHCNER